MHEAITIRQTFIDSPAGLFYLALIMRLLLALRAFFAVLLGRPIPKDLRFVARREDPVVPAIPAVVSVIDAATTDGAAVRALSVFQSEGRLLDFLTEDIEAYGDAEIGAAVREIHRGCRRALKDHFTIVPVRNEEEESRVTVPYDYDPAEIRLVGNVVGSPPFSGTLKHRGWRVEQVRLPRIPEGTGARVVSPAEVEL